MKKNIKIKKGLKAALSMVLCVVMLCSSFACVEPGMFDLSVKADAAYQSTTIGRITQEQVVGVNTSIDGIAARDFWYNVHSNAYFDGCSMPTDIVIPGLGKSSNYTPQGMTYWEEKDWILISAYDAEGSDTSCIYAIDVETGKFVALFNIYNANNTPNTSHGGGIAVSEHNFYFADSGSNISYVPLSELDVAEGTETNITLQGTLNFGGELGGAATSYCCYDDGVLWTGNFYYSGDSSYSTVANANHNSMIMGYKLFGNSSQEEWDYLCGKYTNLLNVTTSSGAGSESGSTLTWSAYKNGSSVDITGDITAPNAFIGEYCPTFGSVTLTEGKQYVFQYITDVDPYLNDFYIFAPNGKHTNIRQASDSVITKLADGRWHVALQFTVGVQPAGADSSWSAGTTGTFTGTYTVRFDQDKIQAGEARDFTFTNVSITEANPNLSIEDVVDNINTVDRIHFAGTTGYPTYIIAIPNTADLTSGDTATKGEKVTGVTLDKIQYAMVDNGRLYLSRSWNRIMDASTYTSEIDVFDICLDVPATNSLTINGATRNDCYVVSGGTRFYNLSMGEALCVIDDYLYTFTESAAYNYRQSDWDSNKSSDDGPTKVASQPIDVVWKIDQYAMMGEDRLSNDDDARVSSFEKITDIDDIKYTDEYMIVYESENRDSNGQKIMYALDSYGGFKDGLVPKNTAGTQANTADSLGIVGHAISRYTISTDDTNTDTLTLLSAEDDLASIRWKIIGAGTGSMRLENQDTYFGQYKNLYFDSRLMYMMPSKNCTTKLDHINIKDNGDGTFSFYYKGDNDYYLWCNDGSNKEYMDTYTSYYNDDYAFGSSNGVKAYAGQIEEPGTFHSDAFYSKEDANSGNCMHTAVPEKYTKFSIYRRADDVNINGKNGLYTNMDAELQEDGTYTLTLESYSTGQTVTKTTTEGKPIDFVFVLDTSGSMQSNSDVAYYGVSDNPEPYDYDWADDSSGSRGFLYGDDTYYWTWAKRSNDQDSSWLRAWYYHTVNTYSSAEGQDYYFGLNSELYPIGSSNQNNMCVSYGFKKNPDKSFAGGYYWVDRTGDATRLEAMKQSTLEFIKQIAAHAEKTGIQHRISIIQYGSTSYLGGRTDENEYYNNTGMYSTSSGVTMQNYSTLISSGFGQDNAVYENAFFPANHDNLEAIIRNISVSGDPDTFVGHGMTMALNAVADQMTDFNKTGDKVGERIYGTYEGTNEAKTEDQVNASACVINISDGAPGYGGDDEDAAYEAAQEALSQANAMKSYDVDIYTVQMGNENKVGSFSNTNFLNALSSNYIGGSTTSKYDDVPQNTFTMGNQIGSGYCFSYDLSGSMDLTGFFENLWNSTSNNTLLETDTVTLNANSVLQHKLGDMFMLTDASKATAKTATISYDSLGVMNEDTPVASSLTPTKDVANNKVQLTGFDYSTKYIADGNAGQKLYLTIENVLLNPDATASDFGINNQENTAIYADATAVSNNIQTQGFPQVNFTVPEYNYISDFGLNMRTEPLIGIPVSVDDAPVKQAQYSTSISSSEVDMKVNGNTANQCTLDIGINPTSGTKATGYSLVKRNDGGYYWAKFNVVPASNVYFEEDDMNLKATDASNTAKADWTDAGEDTNKYRPLAEEGDVVGFDNAYDDANATYSNGNALTATVTASQRNSKTQTFDFVGTGFDLVSRCGSETGILLVNIKNSAGKSIAASLVDTYCKEGTFNQTPVFSWSVYDDEDGNNKGTTYGTYTVEVSALYLSNAGALNAKSKSINKSSFIDTGLEMKASESFDTDVLQAMLDEAGVEDVSAKDVDLVWFDDNSIFNGGTGVAPTKKGTRNTKAVTALVNYIDGFRVYNPLGTDPDVYTESNVSYANVIDNLAALEDPEKPENINGIAFITGLGNDVTSLSFAQYKQSGPKGELYLKADKAISFKFDRGTNEKIMLGLRAVNGATTINVNGHNISINSATEMYYDISHCISETDEVTITVNNAGSNIVAINHIKFSGGDASDSAVINPRSMARSADATAATTNKFLPLTQEDLVAIESVMNAEPIPTVVKNGVVIPLVEEEEEIPEDNTNTDNDNTNDDTDTEESENEEFSLFSLIEMLIAFIERILYNAFGAGSIA